MKTVQQQLRNSRIQTIVAAIVAVLAALAAWGVIPPEYVPGGGAEEAVLAERTVDAPLSAEEKGEVWERWRSEGQLEQYLCRESAYLSTQEWLRTRSPQAWNALVTDVEDYERLGRITRTLTPDP
jgi:hypothetical protein